MKMEKLKIHFETLQFSRTRITELLEGLSVEQLNKIPEGLNTNIIWNVGHILVSQQLFMYKRTGLPFTVNAEIISKFKSGTEVKTDVTQEEIEYIISILFKTLEQVKIDFRKDKFKQFDTFKTKRGVEIKTIEDAINFHTFHEGVHLGWIWTIQKLV
jgi:DinB superfamily